MRLGRVEILESDTARPGGLEPAVDHGADRLPIAVDDRPRPVRLEPDRAEAGVVVRGRRPGGGSGQDAELVLGRSIHLPPPCAFPIDDSVTRTLAAKLRSIIPGRTRGAWAGSVSAKGVGKYTFGLRVFRRSARCTGNRPVRPASVMDNILGLRVRPLQEIGGESSMPPERLAGRGPLPEGPEYGLYGGAGR